MSAIASEIAFSGELDRVGDDAVFGPLDPIHLFGLTVVDRHVAMDYAHSAFSSDRNRKSASRSLCPLAR